MSELTREQIEELIERSKNDRAIIVGSEVRQLANMALRSPAPLSATAAMTETVEAVKFEMHGRFDELPEWFKEIWNRRIEYTLAAAPAPASAIAATSEFVSVPREPTEEMWDAAWKSIGLPYRAKLSLHEIKTLFDKFHAAMLATAPAPAEPVAERDAVISVLSRVLSHGLAEQGSGESKRAGALAQEITNLLGRLVTAPTAPVVEAGTMAHVLSKETIEEWRVCLTSGKDVRYDRDAIEGTALCAMAENWRKVEEDAARSRMKPGSQS